MKKFLAQKKLTVLFCYMLQVHKKNLLSNQRISLLYICTYPSLGKKDILSTLSKLCCCHMGEGLAGQPLQKAVEGNAQAEKMGQQGTDEKEMKISRLTCSCTSPAAAGQPGDSTFFLT